MLGLVLHLLEVKKSLKQSFFPIGIRRISLITKDINNNLALHKIQRNLSFDSEFVLVLVRTKHR